MSPNLKRNWEGAIESEKSARIYLEGFYLGLD